MPGIPPPLHTQLRNTLLECDALADPNQLRAIFTTDDLLRPFRNRLRIANNVNAQVDLLLADLVDSRRSTGESVLVLFLRRLADRYEVEDAMHNRLQQLADSVELALGPSKVDSPAPPSRNDRSSQEIADPTSNPLEYREAIRLLREALASLFPDTTSAERIVEDAGIGTGSIDFSGSAVNRWRNILNVVEKDSQGLRRLIQVARREYPAYHPLTAAADALEASLNAPLKVEDNSVATEAEARGYTSQRPDPTPIEIRRRFALLIGIRDYTDVRYRSLPHTVSDVIALEQVLSAAGYTVRLLHSDQADEKLRPTRDNIWGELENLSQQTGPGDLLLVHFGGHGDLNGDKAYLIAAQTRNASLQRTAVDLDDFKETLGKAPAQAHILFLDACHSGIGRDATGMDPEFERHVILESSGLAILASCRQRQVAYEHNESPHGVFTHFLLQGLRGDALAPGHRFVTFTTLNHYVTDQVARWAIAQGLQQTPNASTELVGDPPLLEISTG